MPGSQSPRDTIPILPLLIPVFVFGLIAFSISELSQTGIQPTVLLAQAVKADETADTQKCSSSLYARDLPFSQIDPATKKHGVVGAPCSETDSGYTVSGQCVAIDDCYASSPTGSPSKEQDGNDPQLVGCAEGAQCLAQMTEGRALTLPANEPLVPPNVAPASLPAITSLDNPGIPGNLNNGITDYSPVSMPPSSFDATMVEPLDASYIKDLTQSPILQNGLTPGQTSEYPSIPDFSQQAPVALPQGTPINMDDYLSDVPPSTNIEDRRDEPPIGDQPPPVVTYQSTMVNPSYDPAYSGTANNAALQYTDVPFQPYMQSVPVDGPFYDALNGIEYWWNGLF